jgi:hypothetical protein
MNKNFDFMLIGFRDEMDQCRQQFVLTNGSRHCRADFYCEDIVEIKRVPCTIQRFSCKYWKTAHHIGVRKVSIHDFSCNAWNADGAIPVWVRKNFEK